MAIQKRGTPPNARDQRNLDRLQRDADTAELKSAQAAYNGAQCYARTGGTGLALNLDDGWRASFGYFASSKATTSTQTAGRTSLTLLKDFRLSDARWQLSLNLRHADHLRAEAADGAETPHTATAWTFFASLAAAF